MEPLHTTADLRSYGLLTGMDRDFPGFGYVGGCAETWTLAGAGHVMVQVQTDVFSGRKGGQAAYDWDKGLDPGDGLSFRVMAFGPPESDISAEAITYMDTTNRDTSLRGTWLLAHMRQGEILITVAMQTTSTQTDAYRQLQAVFAYSQDAFFAHLGALSLDWYTPPSA